MTFVLRFLLLTVLVAFCAAPALAAPAASLRVSGTILVSDPTRLQLQASDGRTLNFRLEPTTTYLLDGQAASQAALVAGRAALVKYHQEANGSLKAKEVKVKSATGSASAPVVVTGSVLALSADTVTVKPEGSAPLTIRLDGATVVAANGGPLVLSALHAGLRVRVKYRVEPDGSLKAQKIKLVGAPQSSFVLDGTLVARGTTLRIRVRAGREAGAAAPSLAGATLSVAVPPAAVVTENGRKKAGGALAVGDRIHVVGTLANGVFTARRVVAQRVRNHK